MRNFKGFPLGFVLGICLALSSLAFAQNTTQTDAKKETESCCAMASCCKGDSCAMKDRKDHASKHEGCCCCGSDACDMKAHEMNEKPKS